MNILCCCTGTKYNDDWVYRLRDMVGPVDRFVCISDREIDGIEVIQATPTLKGWWAKLDYFRPGLFEGPCISLDLDITVTGDVTELAREELTAARETKRRRKMNSSVMAWVPSEKTDRIWTPTPDAAPEFDKHNKTQFFGDQTYIAHMHPDYKLFGDEVMMFRKHLDWGEKELTDATKVVFFNGEPKPHRDIVQQFDWNSKTFEGYEVSDMAVVQHCNWDGST